MKKCFIFAIAFALGAWNAALVGSITCTFLGFIWGFEDTWAKIGLSLPLCALIYHETHALVSKYLD